MKYELGTPGGHGDVVSNNGLLDNPFELSEENMNMLELGDASEFQYLYSGDSVSEKSSPSTNNSHLIQSDPSQFMGYVGAVGNGGQKKTKKQLLEEQDAILLAKDDNELNDQELQLKKKAQNRAAQRAFRERKENKLRNLENQLDKSKADKDALLKELELIRRRNLDMQTENDQLRKKGRSATETVPSSDNFEFPKSENDFVQQILYGNGVHEFKSEHANKVYDSPENGDKVLALGAVWDYLLWRAEEENLNIDVVEVMNKLKGNERCHGFGPAYPVALVDRVIEECS